MKYLKAKQVAEKLHRSVNGMYLLVGDGIIPKPVKLGGKNLWREDMLDAAIAKLANDQGADWDTPHEIAPPPRAPARVPGREASR